MTKPKIKLSNEEILDRIQEELDTVNAFLSKADGLGGTAVEDLSILARFSGRVKAYLSFRGERK